jgi:hypothetical protein
MKFSILALAAIVPYAAAHFKLNWPTSRGFDEDTMPNFPCGGMSQSSNRTKLPLSGGSFPVAIEMHHAQTAVEVLLSLGSDPGDNYNIVLEPTFGVTGLGAFCLPHVAINEKLIGRNLTDGLNATLQVQTNGDPSGGLYAVCLATASEYFSMLIYTVCRCPILLFCHLLGPLCVQQQHQRRRYSFLWRFRQAQCQRVNCSGFGPKRFFFH